MSCSCESGCNNTTTPASFSNVDISNSSIVASAISGSTFSGCDFGTSVDTVAALVALSTTSINSDSVMVLGYHAAGDGGGGLFRLNTSSSATPDNGMVFTPSAGTGRWVRVYSGAVDVRWWGAKGDSTTNDAAAIQAALDFVNSVSGGTVVFPSGTYRITSTLVLYGNTNLVGQGAAKIVLGAGITDKYMLTATGQSRITISGLQVQGNGLAGYASAVFDTCSDVGIENCVFTKGGALGIHFKTSSFVRVTGCDLSNNYYYGIEARDCNDCRFSNNLCYNNGNTGAATSTGGRGIVLWRSRDCVVSFNRFVANTEYGFRIYSEVADTTYSYGNRIVGNYFFDNTVADFVFYDESQAGQRVFRNTVSDNIAVRTTNTTIGAVFVLHGGKNTFVNNHVYKEGAFGTDVAFNLYYAMDCVVSACSASRVAQALSFSGCDNITVDGFLGNEVAQACTAITDDVTIKNSTFYHGGTGSADIGINLNSTPPTGRIILEGLYLDGFDIGILIGEEETSVIRCTTVNSGTYGFQKTGNEISKQEFGLNSFDKMEDYRFGSMTKTRGTNNVTIHHYPGAPISDEITWAVGDRVINSAPAVGQPVGWVCTVAGAPGTWVAQANL